MARCSLLELNETRGESEPESFLPKISPGQIVNKIWAYILAYPSLLHFW